MGLLNKFRKGGGGFLNNVDGVIVGGKFTDAPDFGNEPKGDKTSDFTSLWYALTVRQDGSDQDETTHLFAGSADDFVIGEDGQSLTPVEGAAGLWGGTAFYLFYNSFVEQGGAEGPDPDENGGVYDFSALVGHRVRFVQAKDEEGQRRNAEAFKKNKGQARKKFNAEGQTKGKDGKYYDVRTLQVAQVYGTVDVTGSTSAKGKPAAKGAAAKSTAPAKAAAGKKAAPVAPANSDDIADFAEQVLVELLSSAKDNKLPKSKLNVGVTRLFVTEPYKDRIDDRDPVRKSLYDDDFLATLVEKGLITYDKSGRDQVVALA